MILLIDNYDSFTYNLVQGFGALGAETRVVRNDRIDVAGIERIAPTHLVVSPGPGTPREAGVSNEAILRLAGRLPILGVCLGHQCIAHALGGEVVRAPRLMHGKTSRIHHDGRGVFQGIPDPFVAARYHSLIARKETLPTALVSTAFSDRGELMGLRHRELPLEGVQFHPESYLTEVGVEILRNFLRM